MWTLRDIYPSIRKFQSLSTCGRLSDHIMLLCSSNLIVLSTETKLKWSVTHVQNIRPVSSKVKRHISKLHPQRPFECYICMLWCYTKSFICRCKDLSPTNFCDHRDASSLNDYEESNFIWDLYTTKETHQKQRKFYQGDSVMQASMQRSHISFQLLRFLILQ